MRLLSDPQVQQLCLCLAHNHVERSSLIVRQMQFMREMLHHARLHPGEPLFPAMLSFVIVICAGRNGPDQHSAYKHDEDSTPDSPVPPLLCVLPVDHGSPGNKVEKAESAVAIVS